MVIPLKVIKGGALTRFNIDSTEDLVELIRFLNSLKKNLDENQFEINGIKFSKNFVVQIKFVKEADEHAN